LKVVHYGIQLATLKGKAVIPAHSLAMSVCMSKTAFPMFEVDETTALSYLRTESVVLPSDAPVGYVILSHKGSPLGFVKNIGNRANNLYPSEWRIRHAGK
jgi:NOL1/NOP2/fmu family ribosome biogenesis protein